MSFALDLKQFAAKTHKQIWTINRKVALEVLRRVVMRTPVESGRAKGNWQTSVGTPIEREIERTDKGGGSVISSAVSVIESWESDNVSIFLMNNLPYIGRLEDGYSSQAPAGMVKITVAEFQQIVNTGASDGI